MNEKQPVGHFLYLFIICLLSINACTHQISSSLADTKAAAISVGFQSQLIQTKNFDLFAFIKNDNVDADKIVIYIEGDGHAWNRRNVLSSDPTPRNPISLNLAINDPRPFVFYLARPCQYLQKSGLEDCSPEYWSTHRYSQEVIASINEAITEIKSRTTATTIEIIGYSGGGVIAMLIAANRNDVSRIVTIASNIDHESWSEWHDVSRLDGSLIPMNYLTQLQDIKQLHVWGERDKTVPYETQLMFIERSKKNNLFEYKLIPDFTHDCCWVDQWRDILRP